MSEEELEGQAEQPQEDPNAAWETEKAEYERKLQEATQREQQWTQKYNQDVGTLTAYAQSLAAQRQQQAAPQPAAEPEEEETPEERKIRQKLERQMQQAQQAYSESQAQANRATARSVFQHRYSNEWQRWGGEIEQMLSQYPVAVTASVDAYEAALKAVKAMHYDEILEEEIAKRAALQKSETEDGEGEAESAGTLPSPSTSPAAPPVRTTAAPGRVSRKSKKVDGAWSKLPEEDRKFLRDHGMTQEDFDKFSDPKHEGDPYGFKGRNVIGDEEFSAYHNLG